MTTHHPIQRRIVLLCTNLLMVFGQAQAQIELPLRKYLPELEVRVTLGSGETTIVRGPEVELEDSGEPFFDWHLLSKTTSPDGKFTAVHYLGSRLKYWRAVVYLVDPSGKVVPLKKSMVRKVVWSQDGKYLLGLGDNTFRIWNQVGTERQITFDSIFGFKENGKTICLAVRQYEGEGNATTSTDLAVVISFPELQILSRQPLHESDTCNAVSNQ